MPADSRTTENEAAIKKQYNDQIAKEQAELQEFLKEYRKVPQGNRRELQNTPELMTKMQMIFQDPIASINPRMTVREIIAKV